MPLPPSYDPGGGPAAALRGFLRRLVLLLLVLFALLVAGALFAGGPFLQILLNILLSS